MAAFNNFATLSYNGMKRVSNLVTGEIVSSLLMTKTAVVDGYMPGGSITYAVSIRNTGTTDLGGLSISDDLGAYPFGENTLTPLSYSEGSLLYYINGELQTSPTVTSTTDLQIEGISVPAGGSAMILYTVKVNEYAPPCAGGQIDNTVNLTGGSLTEAVTAGETVTPLCEPELSITKAVDPTAVAENGELTYTFVITNTGGLAATTEDTVVLTDTFDPILKAPVVTLNGSQLTTQQFVYDTDSGKFSTNPGVITVPAAEFTQDPESGVWTVDPGASTLTVNGTI